MTERRTGFLIGYSILTTAESVSKTGRSLVKASGISFASRVMKGLSEQRIRTKPGTVTSHLLYHRFTIVPRLHETERHQ